MNNFNKLSFLLCLLFLNGGCATYEYHDTSKTSLSKGVDNPDINIDEDEILDVGIVLLNSGLDLFDDDTTTYSSVRESDRCDPTTGAVSASSCVRTVLRLRTFAV